MKRYISFLIGCLAAFAVTYAQDIDPIETDVMPTIYETMKGADGYTVFTRLIEACGLQTELSKIRDEEYEKAYQSGQIHDLPTHPTEPDQPGTMPEHRYYGYTLFAETDDVWESLLGKKAADISVANVKNYLISKGLYPKGSKDDDFTNSGNIVNLFTTYHILPERLAPDKLVIHYNEYGYYFATTKQNYTVPVYEYYTTLGQRRLLKVFESRESEGIYLNRFPILRNGRGEFTSDTIARNNDYHESGKFQPMKGSTLTENENEGILVWQRNVEDASYINAMNGVAYPLSSLLAYTENIQNQLGSERLRFDVASLFPEMMNNDIRRPMDYYSYGATFTRGFVPTSEYPYLENIDISEGSRFYYFGAYQRSWSNYQMDEFNIIGAFDFTMRLPPVPVDGEYELRFGVSSGSSRRSIVQCYFGEDKDNLQAAQPMDMRIGFVRHRFPNTTINSRLGYASESDYQYEARASAYDQRLVDLRLHEQGFMKGPNYFHCGASNTANVGRQCEWVLRRVVWKGYLEAGKTYYIRFKNGLDDTTSQFYMDYIEWCPKEVYDNPETPEDIW